MKWLYFVALLLLTHALVGLFCYRFGVASGYGEFQDFFSSPHDKPVDLRTLDELYRSKAPP